ncbi:DUF397 domain-containing protein [Kineosporia babensis]|uniref:DUF397 domain-containing protein n=1 Tax=Kineosporia babensis TaxID=499548 RepID=UPI0038B41126
MNHSASAVPTGGGEEDWQRSSFCSASTCIEVLVSTEWDTVKVRDSKHKDGSVLKFDLAEWRAFVAGVRNSEFDV